MPYRSSPVRVRADANNLWYQDPKAALPYLLALDRDLFAVEEPVYPDGDSWSDAVRLRDRVRRIIVEDSGEPDRLRG